MIICAPSSFAGVHGDPGRTTRLPRAVGESQTVQPHVVTALLTVRGAATYLGISESTLYVWRHRRIGPPSFRLGPRGRVMYRRTALDSWLDEQEASDSRSNITLSPLAQATRHHN